jgi:hypothetical protein
MLSQDSEIPDTTNMNDTLEPETADMDFTIETIERFDGPKEYLGDGAYVRFTGHDFIVSAENGVDVLRFVSLDMRAIDALNHFVKRVTSPSPVGNAATHPAISGLLERVTEAVETNNGISEWIKRHAAQLNRLAENGIVPSLFYGNFDFDQLSHEKVIHVIQEFPGRWVKTLNATGAHIDYTLNVDGRQLRCYMGEPPPSCRIIEVDEVVPAQPETIRKVKKLECGPEQAAVVPTH